MAPKLYSFLLFGLRLIYIASHNKRHWGSVVFFWRLLGAILMMNLALSCLLLGAVLGLRFKVMILVPVMVIGFVAAPTSLLHGYKDDIWLIVLTMALVGTGLQLGFLGGLVTRFVIASTRVFRSRIAEEEPANEAI